MTTLYGIKNCDTVKKARTWLDTNGVDYVFHDIRADGLDENHVAKWVKDLGWEATLNKRSTTWKQLDDASKADIDAAKAIALIVDNPTLFKRPVLEHSGTTYNGFKADQYQSIFQD